MIASTPTSGGYYLVDVIVGAVVLPLTILVFGRGQPRSAKEGLGCGVLSAAPD
jgi:hypothetical protein